MTTIGPGMLARTRFWRSKTPGEGSNIAWCGKLVHVDRKIPVEQLQPKYLRDDKVWFEITFLDGQPPDTHTPEELAALIAKAAADGKTIKHVWPWPSIGLEPLDGSSEASTRKVTADA